MFKRFSLSSGISLNQLATGIGLVRSLVFTGFVGCRGTFRGTKFKKRPSFWESHKTLSSADYFCVFSYIYNEAPEKGKGKNDKQGRLP